MASRRRPPLKPPHAVAAEKRRPLVYTAQDVAGFCEVDLKTVHHWADRGKIPHRRTEGRHLRFRRNDVVGFLKAHGYPIPDALARCRPTVLFSLPAHDSFAIQPDEIAKRLASRFLVERHPSAVSVLARLVATEPDAIVLPLESPAFAAIATVPLVKADPAIAWIRVAVVAPAELIDAVREAGADVVIAESDVGKLGIELATDLAVG